MQKRFLSIWFRYLKTDWYTRRHPELADQPFVLAAAEHGRMMVAAANAMAILEGIDPGTVLADARAIVHGLQVYDDEPGMETRLLQKFGEWCIRFSPVVSVDPPDGLMIDITGCAHLWGGEEKYLDEIYNRISTNGYKIRIAIAGTSGAARAIARFGKDKSIVSSGNELESILCLPPVALGFDIASTERLHKLGLRQVKDFISMPSKSLQRRFGTGFITRLNYALGLEEEIFETVQPVQRYQERLPCLEPIATATGIEIALTRLLETICLRLKKEEKGLRKAVFRCYRIDGVNIDLSIGTTRPSYNSAHLYKLFENALPGIEPALGIELFSIEALQVEDHSPAQEEIWQVASGIEDNRVAELLDRIEGKLGEGNVHRYLPAPHHWPERSFREAASTTEKITLGWRTDQSRPLSILAKPEPIEVAAPIPDYPPMLFRHKGKLHRIKKADGPERIEREWWLEQGEHRDYYTVEDEDGQRYWVFRSGHYSEENKWQWFLGGFFA